MDAKEAAKHFENLCKDKGFTVIHCEGKPIDYSFETEIDHYNMLKSLDPFLKRIPDEQKDEYLKDVMDEMKKLEPDPEKDLKLARYTKNEKNGI